jgi:hypothetical protein
MVRRRPCGLSVPSALHPHVCRTLRISCEAVPPSVQPTGAQGGTSACHTGAALSFVSCIRLFDRVCAMPNRCRAVRAGQYCLGREELTIALLTDPTERRGVPGAPRRILGFAQLPPTDQTVIVCPARRPKIVSLSIVRLADVSNDLATRSRNQRRAGRPLLKHPSLPAAFGNGVPNVRPVPRAPVDDYLARHRFVLAHSAPPRTLSRRSNTADQLRSGAPVRHAGGGTGRHLSSQYGCRPELRQLHPLVRRRPSSTP